MHYRKQIRTEIIDRLKNGVSIEGSSQKMALDVGGRVWFNRTQPLEDDDLPCALLSAGQERIRDTDTSQSTLYRVLPVNVDLVGLQRDGIEDLLDRLAWQTEIILLCEHTLGLDQVNMISLTTTDPYNPNTDGEQERGFSRLAFEIDYWTEVHVPGTIDEFLNYGEKIETQGGAFSEFETTIREA